MSSPPEPVRVAVLLIALGSIAAAWPASAQELPTSITVTAPATADPGASVPVSGRLVLAAAQGFALQPIDVYMEGTLVASTRTNVLGDFNVNVQAPAVRGLISFEATWNQVDFEERSAPVQVLLAEPPTPPASVAVLSDNGHAPTRVTWEAPTDDGGAPVQTYTIYRKIGTGPRVPVATLGPASRAWDDGGAPGGETILYRVLVQTARANATSPDVAVVMGPTAPRDLKAIANGSGQGADLTWNHPSGTTPIIGYKIRRDGALLADVPGTQRAYEDAPLTEGFTYVYSVSAVSDVGEGAPGSVTFATAPLATLGFTASPVFIDRAIHFTWDAPTAQAGITQFRIERWNGGTSWTGAITLPGNATSADARELSYNTTYTFRIAARNPAGWGAYSFATETTDAGPYTIQHGTSDALVCPPPPSSTTNSPNAPAGCGFVATGYVWTSANAAEQTVGAWTSLYVRDVNSLPLKGFSFDAWAVTLASGPCPADGSACADPAHVVRFDHNMTLTTSQNNGQLLFTPSFDTFQLPIGECWHVLFALRMTHARVVPNPTDDYAAIRLCRNA